MKTIKQKKFPAKYTGTCRPCGEPIMPGEEIFYSKELGASHVRCSASIVSVPELPAPADYEKPKKRRKYKKPEVQSAPAPVNNAPAEPMSYATLRTFALRCYDLLTPEQQQRAGDDLMRDLVNAAQESLSEPAQAQSRPPEGQAPSKASGASDGALAPRVADSAKRVRDRGTEETCADCDAPLPSGGFAKMGESVRCAKCFEANWGHAPEREPGEEG